MRRRLYERRKRRYTLPSVLNCSHVSEARAAAEPSGLTSRSRKRPPPWSRCILPKEHQEKFVDGLMRRQALDTTVAVDMEKWRVVEGCQSFNAPRFCGDRVPLNEFLDVGDHPTSRSPHRR